MSKLTNSPHDHLAVAIALQAARDYFLADEKGKKAILKDLRSSYMVAITDGYSIIVAERLTLHPEETHAIMTRASEEINNV